MVIHHMDHLLLGDRSWWARLKPDVVLQLGAHGTSKRVAQFLVRGQAFAKFEFQIMISNKEFCDKPRNLAGILAIDRQQGFLIKYPP